MNSDSESDIQSVNVNSDEIRLIQHENQTSMVIANSSQFPEDIELELQSINTRENSITHPEEQNKQQIKAEYIQIESQNSKENTKKYKIIIRIIEKLRNYRIRCYNGISMILSNKEKLYLIAKIIFMICATLNLIGGPIITLILFLNGAYSDKEIRYMAFTINSIHDNFRMNPWGDIQITYNDTCPQGYNLTNVGNWTGTKDSCEIFSDDENELDPKKCDNENKFTKKKDIPEQKSIPFYSWKNMGFCVKAIDNSFYYNHYNTISCKEGELRCSGVCLINATTCPITNLSITNDDYIPDQLTQKIKIDNPNIITNRHTGSYGQWLYISRYPNNSPIVNLENSFYGLPCRNKLKAPYEPIHYQLSSKPGEGCGSFGTDPKSALIDIDYEKSIMSYNGLDYLYTQLPYYNQITIQRLILLTQMSRYSLNATSNNTNCIAFLESNNIYDIVLNALKFDYYIYGRLRYAFFSIIKALAFLFCFVAAFVDFQYSLFTGMYTALLFLIPEFDSIYDVYTAMNSAYPQISIIMNMAQTNCFEDDGINQIFNEFAPYHKLLYDNYTKQIIQFLLELPFNLILIGYIVFFCTELLYDFIKSK